jgi:hypothetical protein
VRVDGLQYTAQSNDGAAASVQVTGPMQLQFAESASQPNVAATLAFRLEDGTWRYCPSSSSPGQSVPGGPATQVDLSGRYRSEFGPVTLQQQGSTISGSWSTPPDDAECADCVGEITEGMISPGRLAFKWLRTWNGARGAASCGVVGDEIRCAYTSDAGSPGSWTMVREP